MIEQTARSYFRQNELAASVWAGKYALKNKKKEQIETTPDQMHRRLAREFARIEAHYSNGIGEELINSLFHGFSKIIPQGSVMAILGNTFQIGSLSNCIVLPKIYDSYGGIFYADQQLAQVMKRRCGAGVDISTLRNAYSAVSNAAQSSTGAPSFMHRFSNTTREVAQDGRRGALMISLDVRHPDAEEFTIKKQDLTQVTGANVSLRITDEFMQAVEKNADFFQRFPITFDNIEYMDGLTRHNGVGFDDKEYPRYYNKLTKSIEGGEVFKRINANSLWDVIVKCAHSTAEPGLIFWDRQHYYSTSSLYPEFENISTNPCSEIAMGNDSCRLIAKNMFSCVKNPFTKQAYFDFEEWFNISYNTMRLMDDLVDLEIENINKILEKIEKDPEPEHIKAVERATWEQLKQTGIRGRRTGSGYTAVGDVFAALGLKYASKESLQLFEKICKTKMAADLDSTIDMAEQRGAFPAFDAELEAKWAEDPQTMFYMLKKEFPQQWTRMQKIGRRNISWSTIAPTGSLSLLAQLDEDHFGTTSGIEPLFKVYYIRRKKINPNDKDTRVDFIDPIGDKWQEFPVFHEGFKMWYDANPCFIGREDGTNYKMELSDFNKDGLYLLIKSSPYGGSTADEIDWIQRIELQAIAQRYITHSISSTINLPKDVTTDEVSKIYFESWKRGLKGITIYRDGCRSGVLVSESVSTTDEFIYHNAPKRPKELDAELHTVSVKGEKYAVLVGFLGGKPYEVFAFNGREYAKTAGKITKVKKGHYRFTADDLQIEDIQELATNADEQLVTRMASGMLRHGVNPKYIYEQIDKCPLEVVTFGKALNRIIKKYIPEKELLERHKCKDCGSNNIRFEEGCSKCLDCGSSKCG